MDIERDLRALGGLPGSIRWLLAAPTDLEPVWEYGICPVDGCAALTRFLEPWTRIDRARRIDAIELHARMAAAMEEINHWHRRVRGDYNRRKRRPKRRNEAVAAVLTATARQIEDYLQCRRELTPREWVEQALAAVERLYVLRPRDSEYQHGISFAVSGLEQALGQLPE
ncbi:MULTISPECIES: hypothetical protein [unclassified Lysobacter]|uniref:hypothetical protein n=1 Tax=unclassified Lysobacter TaxID=2635362 RepID=UPI001BE6DDE2|nr:MULTISPECIES: hypothetical protein [unclassified Lysobacter]MBT2748566.1 hypothetical protein [Lysobacter sp. ISL-42]MBT2751501.1 hypothetical protein [Lysobacter sp. ISL-50]MBT2775695.1 hypothetical protein [Lysobacter sp. ISL-54]MBT2782340.1 hypothetical protein [Lysobacter sp. ISL-52]